MFTYVHAALKSRLQLERQRFARPSRPPVARTPPPPLRLHLRVVAELNAILRAVRPHVCVAARVLPRRFPARLAQHILHAFSHGNIARFLFWGIISTREKFQRKGVSHLGRLGDGRSSDLGAPRAGCPLCEGSAGPDTPGGEVVFGAER